MIINSPPLLEQVSKLLTRVANSEFRFVGIGKAHSLVWTSFNHVIFEIGSFGRVLLSKNKKSGEFFAMKRLKKADIIKLRQVDHVISENTILADIDHPFLVSIICK
jgi:hypothetical protein